MALTCKVPLLDFLAKIEKHRSLRDGYDGLKGVRGAREMVGCEARKV
jgi:hypothetical protein